MALNSPDWLKKDKLWGVEFQLRPVGEWSPEDLLVAGVVVVVLQEVQVEQALAVL